MVEPLPAAQAPTRAPCPPEAAAPLFRAEAVQALRVPLQGSIVLLPGAPSRWWALAALAVVLALALLLSLGSYTRRSTVSGVLLPAEGLIRINAPQPGVVSELLVRDGQTVRRGQPLLVLSGDRAGPEGQGFQADVAAKIQARQESIRQQLQRVEQAAPVEVQQLQQRIASLDSERDQVGRQAEQLRLRIAGAEESLRRHDVLSQQGLLSREEVIARQADLNELRIRLQGNRREALVLQRDAAAAQRELDGAQMRSAQLQAELRRAQLQAGQEFTELEARRRIVVAAPADGQLTLLQAEPGQGVDPARALAHVVPAGAALVARLYAPSRAAGFAKPGEKVLLRVEAFPYQKYGQQPGTVSAVSAAGMAASELQGVALRPEWAGDTLFAIQVQLPAAPAGRQGEPLRLQAGMRVEADLLHETRRLYEWILEPLHAARSRLGSS